MITDISSGTSKEELPRRHAYCSTHLREIGN